MALLNFNTGNTSKQTLKTAPAKYILGKLRYNFEQSEGQRPSEAFYPSKYLPVQFRDVETDEFVVIPKGKVVSALGYGEFLFSETTGQGANASGTLGAPHQSGQIPVFQDRDSVVIKRPLDETFWGYNESVNGLLVPANGGTDRNLTTANAYEYQALDATAATFKQDGTIAVAEDDVIAGVMTSGNIPIGVAMMDIYQDIRGRNLNYGHWDKWGILVDWFVTVPYVRQQPVTAFDTDLSSETTLDDSEPMDSLRDQTFLAIASGTIPRTGSTIKADVRGNYEIQSSSVTANTTVQTVARLMTLDNRFPKDLLEFVDTYEGSNMAGTDTGGIPYWLFIFAFNYLTQTLGSSPSIATIQNHVRDGSFGMARFNLHVN